MDFVPRALAFGVGAPILVATGVLWGVWRTRDAEATRARRVVTAGALAGLFTLAWVAGFGMPPVPAKSGADWMLLVAIAGGVLSVIAAAWPGRGVQVGVHWVARAAVLAGGMYLVARNLINNGSGLMAHGPTIAGFVVAGLGAWWGVTRASREAGPLPPVLIVIAATMTSVVAALTGNIQHAISPAVLCAVVGPGMIVAMLRPRFSFGEGAGLAGAFLSVLWFFLGVLGETPVLMSALCAASAVMVGVSGLGALGKLRGLKAWVVRGVLVALPGLVAVAWALTTINPEDY